MTTCRELARSSPQSTIAVFLLVLIFGSSAATRAAEAADWRYTFDQPADGWTSPHFDDSTWQSGAAPFGTPGTPGISPGTNWASDDIYLRQAMHVPPNAGTSLQLLVFHDEDVEIYFDGVLAARAGGFVREYVPMDISSDARRLMKPGSSIVVAVHCHQTTGGQGVDVRLEPISTQQQAIRRRRNLRDFAMSNTGDAAVGKRLFESRQRLGCVRCHTTDGSASHAGPDLLTIGDKFPRGELIEQVLNPSSNIAVGYATTIVATRSGDAFVGIVKEANDDHVAVMGGDGKLVRIAAADIKSRRTQANVSLMPSDLDANLSPQEFTNLVEYLVSLRLPEVADAGRQGMPAHIPELDPPIKVEAINSEENRFHHPCWMGQVPGEPGTFLVLEHETGRVWRLVTGVNETKTLWGDFAREVRPGPAIGLLGLAFHPHFRENRKYYIQHEVDVGGGRLVARVTEKIASDDFTRDSGTPSRTIIEFPCSTDVHAGGGIAFGPDGYLYIGMGDTGPMGDPEGHAQNLRLPQGKMLRIDVNSGDDAKTPYKIPPDNPFIARGSGDARPEIFAYGLREPWRFSFDSATGDLWVGDVGQDRIEEVDIVRAGENYGWNVYEGFDLFSTRYRSAASSASIPPVFAYNRRFGNSITGGYVYRDGGKSAFDGVYVCGDYTSRRVWGLRQSDRKLTEIRQLCMSPQPIASFGRDEAGTIYIVGYDGTLYKLDFASAAVDASTAGPAAN